jgi:hypothetical protein
VPLRGESVGTAYIRLIADGTGIPDDIRDSVDDATKSFHDPGSRAAKAFKAGWTEELEKHDDRGLQDAFNKALINDEATARFFQSTEWRNVEKNFRAKFGSLGQAAADDMKKQFLKSGSLEGLEHEIENVASRVNQIFDKALADNEKITRERTRNMEKFEQDFRAAMEESSRVSRQVSQDNVSNLENLRRTLERLRTSAVTPFAREWEKARISLNKSGRDVDVNRSRMARLAVTIDHLADGVGRAFGKGSRSELLNFTGSFIGNSVRLLGLLPRLAGNISEFSTGFKEARVAGDGFFSALKSGFTTAASDAEGASTALSSLVSSGVAAIPLLVVALLAVVEVLTVVASLISGIVAAIVALASTIAFGLVGAIAPLIGLIGPLPIIIGAIVAGVVAMATNTDKLKKIVTPLVDEFKKLGGAVEDGFFKTFDLKRGVQSVLDLMGEFEPVFRGIGEQIGIIATNLSQLGDNPTFRRFLNQMTDFAPFVVGSLSRSLGNVGLALTAIFTDLIPLTKDFLGWLEKITGEFHDFVTENPKKVTDFFEGAADSAKILGGFLKAVVGLFITLIDAGKSTGDSLFQRLTKNINEWNDALKPQGGTRFDEATGGIKRFKQEIPAKNPLDEFFKNGEQTAEDLGEIAEALGKIAGALDSLQSSETLHTVLDGVAFALDKLQGPAKFLSEHPLTAFFSVILGPAGPALASIQVFFDAAWQPIRNFARKVDDFLHRFQFKGGLGGRIKDLFGGGGGGITPLTLKPPKLDWIPGVLNRIQSLARNSIAAFFPVPTLVNRALGRIDASPAARRVAAVLGSIPSRLQGLAGQFGHQAALWAEAVFNQIVDLPGRIIGLFRGLGQRIADAIGDINIHVNLPDKIPGTNIDIPFTAVGGIFDHAQWRVIGEAGREAVVPLDRPLSEVDPSVRWLAALARGGPGAQGVPTNVPVGSGKTINNEWHITTPTTDTRAVADELLNRMVATAYA